MKTIVALILGWTLYINGQVVDTDVETACLTDGGWTVVMATLSTGVALKPGQMCSRGETLVVKTHKGIVYFHRGSYTLVKDDIKP